MKRKQRFLRKIFPLVFFVCLFFVAFPVFAQKEIKEINLEGGKTPVGAGGLTFKYKRVTGPYGFGGEIPMWGIRGFGDREHGSKFGLSASYGTLAGKSMKLTIGMGGFSIENAIKTDWRITWRLTFGGGYFALRSRNSKNVFREGKFAFFEPMIFGTIPMTQHFRLEIGGGYLFTQTLGVKIEGPCIQLELLVGRY